ncbi:TonB-dependent receptor [Sphingomonas sp. R-74633]|uniref:TonB-dependent receptor n=1 Tax=Sphingomonas sp. R-74633 TaxID=2751188 RepID=UPI0015D1EBE6|nr:TonB-dependent receptor [Sphingomonas sp. R-74633]NYT41935.1 TonB-dependent receptor [Sphingomonas sp. R-74633]
MKGRYFALTTVSLLAMAQLPAQAQQTAPEPVTDASGVDQAGPPETGVQDSIVVTGTRAALENAERVKRDSAVIVDGISADDISALPDASIADSLVRITGVSSNDNPRGPNAVSIRGLGPDLTLITVNGRVLPSGSGGDRRLELAQLPTEGIAGAYVQKTPDAATMEGGVAGVLDMRTIRPLTSKRNGFTLVGRTLFQDNARSLSDARRYGDVGARAEATYVGHLTDTLAVSATYSFLHQYSGFAGVQVDNWRLGTGPRADLNADGKADALPTNVGVTSNFNDDVRHSAIGAVQWDGGNGLKATLDGIFIVDRLYNGPTRFFANNIFNGTGLGAATSASVDSTNTAQAFSGQTALYRGIYNESRQVDHTFGGGLNLAYETGPLTAALDLSYFKATRRLHSPQATVETDGAAAANQRQPISYDISDPDAIAITFNPLTADDYALSQLQDNYTRVNDSIKTARGDFAYKPDSEGFLQSIQFGARFEERNHTNAVDASQWSWATLPTRPDLDGNYLQLPTNPFANIASLFGGGGATNFPYFDLGKLLNLKTAPGVTFSNQFANDIAGDFRIKEDTIALYAQANFHTGPLSGNAGLRWISTDLGVKGQSGTTPANVQQLSFKNTYRYLLPSLNVRYDISRTLLARFAFSKTMSRQQFNDLAVSSAVDLTTVPSGVLTINRGNPNLAPFTSNGVDVSMEWAPSRSTNIAVAGYVKYLKNFLVPFSESTNVTLTDGSVVPAIIQTTMNDPKMQMIRGVEFTVRQDLSFLPGFLRNFGVQMNLNYNGTDIDQTAVSIINNSGAANTAVGTTAPVTPDQFTKFVINGQLYYSDKTFDIRLAYRHFDPYLRAFFNSYQEQPDGQLDLSGGVNLAGGVRLIGSVTNLTKARMRRWVPDYRNSANNGLTQLSVYQGRLVTLGLRTSF